LPDTFTPRARCLHAGELDALIGLVALGTAELLEKSKCHHERRYSPSVTSCMPMSSCFLISFSISVSSTFVS
jgi:hypothetical protein